jgi:hypothetical protein
MTTRSEYHLKELVWFHGWTPSHWILIDAGDGLTAHCTRAEVGYVKDKGLTSEADLLVSPEILARIEKVRPGSLPAIMGFDFLLCEGEPGSILLNRPMNFPLTNTSPTQGAETW